MADLLFESTLYSSSNCYEDEEIRISIYKGMILLSESTSEHAPGEKYGMTHILDGDSAGRFMKHFDSPEGPEYGRIAELFKGKDAVRIFKDFCEKNSIEYKSYLT